MVVKVRKWKTPRTYPIEVLEAILGKIQDAVDVLSYVS